jgi:predicted DNA-binding transcriptional regulator YafY
MHLSQISFFALLVSLWATPLGASQFDHARLCEAITKSQYVKLYYRAGEPERIVEPRFLGYTKDRSVILNGWQIGGYSESGNLPGSRSFRLDRATRIEFTTEAVPNARSAGKSPSGIIEMICQVSAKGRLGETRQVDGRVDIEVLHAFPVRHQRPQVERIR